MPRPAMLMSCLTAVALSSSGTQAAPTEEELWLMGTETVNDGQLHFLTTPPAQPVHLHQNRIVLTPSSLVDGWARLEQCHSHIDAVPRSQITYSAKRIRGLTITRAEDVGRAWVENSTVQLTDIGHAATVCISAETRALESDGQGGFQLRNGPYMRRFLDGYYPMRVSMTVRLETPALRYRDITPPPQPGFTVRHASDEVGYDTVFEGRLITRIGFDRVPTP